MAGAQSLGAIPVPMYQESEADEIKFVLDHASVRLYHIQIKILSPIQRCTYTYSNYQ